MAWRALLALWVRRADPDKRHKRDSLLSRAGAARANAALALFERLLAEGLVEVEERRNPQQGWQFARRELLEALERWAAAAGTRWPRARNAGFERERRAGRALLVAR